MSVGIVGIGRDIFIIVHNVEVWWSLGMVSNIPVHILGTWLEGTASFFLKFSMAT